MFGKIRFYCLEEYIMRIGNHSRLFWTQGKSIFGKKDNPLNPDDSLNIEEKNALLSETNPNDNGSNQEQTTNIEFGAEIKELGRKISHSLTDLRKIIEEGKLSPNSRDWVGSALHILGRCVDIASNDNQKDLEKLFLDMARIIYSSDRVGKANLSIDPALELYSPLCCIVADFIRGKPNKPMFEQWSKIYHKVVDNLNNSGIRLVDDNEEPVTTTIKETDKTMMQTASKIITQDLSEKPTEPVLSETTDFSPNPFDVENIEIPQTDVFLQKEKEVENFVESASSFLEENKSEAIRPTEEAVSTETIEYSAELEAPEDKKLNEESEQLTNYTTEERIVTSPIESPAPESESISLIPSEPPTKRFHIDINSYLQYINQIPQDEVKEILLDTLKAIASGTPETAKIKALELATEMAKLEVDKVKTDRRSVEFQIDSLTSEVSQVEEQLQICQTEIKTLNEELKEQESSVERTGKEKELLEKNILDTNNKIAEIDRKIQELQKQKELELTSLKEYEENLVSTQNTIEEFNSGILSLKESIQDIENQSRTLVQRMDLLELMKTEKNSQLKKLQQQIKEKENIVQHLEQTLRVLQPLTNYMQNPGIDDINIQNDGNNPKETIDLFNEKV